MFHIAEVPPQLDFPSQDIDEDSFDKVVMMLQDEPTIDERHDASKVIVAYRELHPLLKAAFKGLYDNPGRVAAMDHGVKVFEAMTTILTSHEPMAINDKSLKDVLNSPDVAQWATDPFETEEVSRLFGETMPYAAQAIVESAKVFHGDRSAT